MKRREIKPATITIANGFCVEPIPVASAEQQPQAGHQRRHRDGPIDKRCAIALADRRRFAQRNLLAVGCAYRQLPNFVSAAAKLRLHANHQIEQLLPLNDLGGCLAAYRCRNHRFYIGNVDPIAGNRVGQVGQSRQPIRCCLCWPEKLRLSDYRAVHHKS